MFAMQYLHLVLLRQLGEERTLEKGCENYCGADSEHWNDEKATEGSAQLVLKAVIEG